MRLGLLTEYICLYKIEPVYYMECIFVADDLETYKCYWPDDKKTLGIYADEDLLVESVYLLVAD